MKVTASQARIIMSVIEPKIDEPDSHPSNHDYWLSLYNLFSDANNSGYHGEKTEITFRNPRADAFHIRLLLEDKNVKGHATALKNVRALFGCKAES